MTSYYVPHTRIPTLVFPQSAQAASYAALTIERLIRQNNAAERPTVLGLATGSTPVGLYRELIRLHQDQGLDFSRVITFNLDEYCPMLRTDPHSYYHWMHETFFQHVNILPENIHIPDGELSLDAVEDYCMRYEQAIRQAGGIDLQILGIGRSGHIGFNEPGATRHSRTRLVTLDPVTRRDAASSFYGEENVPHRAITMGIGTILEARKIVLMAFGEHKAAIVQKTLEQEVHEPVPASFLQDHRDTEFLLDPAAAGQLASVRRPWEVGPVRWTEALIRHAVIWLSLKVKKPLLKLSDEDFREHHLYDLLRERGPAEAIGERVFADRFATICSRPAGEDPQTILVFSPHPDDDVISMGGTLIRLVEQGHNVHVAYMTNGNIAVFDHDARRFADFMECFNQYFGIAPNQTTALRQQMEAFLDSKKPGQPDSPELLQVKTLIRATEARAAARACGIPTQRLHFLDLRFYRTGKVAKAPLQPEDIADIEKLLLQLRPFRIYVAGELSDPHGTHRMCAEAVFQAVARVQAQGFDFDVWLYRGAWEEWEPHEIDEAVPLSPAMLERKKLAIFRHQSQKDRAMYPGTLDSREFWQRAEQRNRETALLYDALGLPEFYALEGFVHWQPEQG